MAGPVGAFAIFVERLRGGKGRFSFFLERSCEVRKLANLWRRRAKRFIERDTRGVRGV